MSPDKLRALAAELEAIAKDNLRAAKRLRAQAARLESAALQDAVSTTILNRDPMEFSAERRTNMGRAKLKNPRNALAKAAYEAKRADGGVGYSFVELAREVGITGPLLTMAYSGKRAMPKHVAEKIQALIGYPVGAWKRLS